MVVVLGRLIQHSDLAPDKKREALGNWRRATADEVDILTGIFEIPEAQRFTGEIFRGAHVRICDKGARYDDWKTLPSADTRRSSHDSDGAQYHVDGPLAHTILFGKFGNRTWLQLEAHPMYDLVNIAGHFIDYFKYRASGENQGPYGSSPRAEKNRPIEIQPTGPYVPIDRSSWAFKMSRQPRPPGRSPCR
jgi:hypothetical protein